MDFGFTLKPDHSLERVASLTRLAERCGFTHGWVFDSHVLWKEPYVLLTLMAQNSTRLRLGPCVTNPATREPSVTASALAVLQILSKGRMDLGIGRGDSARRVLGKKPTTLDDLEEATVAIRDLCEGGTVTYDGIALTLDWAEPYDLPVWIAGYGPKALALTGRVAERRRDPARRPEPPRVVRRSAARRSTRGGSGSEGCAGHGRCTRARREEERRPRARALVPRDGQ